MEKVTGKDLNHLKNKVNKLNRNFIATKRKSFKEYSKYIEPVLDSIMVHNDGNHWRFFWKRSSLLTKIYLLYVLFLPIWFYVSLQLSFVEREINDEMFLALWPMVFAIVILSAILIVFNILFCYGTIGLFLLFKYESGIFNKNVATLEAISESKVFYENYALVLGLGGAIGSSALSRLGGFKGLGGGHFGGGGAGGSW